jgi:hypothetical protein
LNKSGVGHFSPCSCSYYSKTPRKTSEGLNTYSLISYSLLSFPSRLLKNRLPSSQQMKMEMKNDLALSPFFSFYDFTEGTFFFHRIKCLMT